MSLSFATMTSTRSSARLHPRFRPAIALLAAGAVALSGAVLTTPAQAEPAAAATSYLAEEPDPDSLAGSDIPGLVRHEPGVVYVTLQGAGEIAAATLTVQPASYQAGDTVTMSVAVNVPNGPSCNAGDDPSGIETVAVFWAEPDASYRGGKEFGDWNTLYSDPAPQFPPARPGWDYQPDPMSVVAGAGWNELPAEGSAFYWMKGDDARPGAVDQPLPNGTYAIKTVVPADNAVPAGYLEISGIPWLNGDCWAGVDMNFGDMAPTFDLTATADEHDAGLTHLSYSTEYRDLKWDFGDGQTAEGDVAEHRYEKPGDYTIELCTSNYDCGTATVSFEPPELAVDFAFVDATTGAEIAPDDLPVGGAATVRLTATAGESGLGALSTLTVDPPLEELLDEAAGVLTVTDGPFAAGDTAADPAEATLEAGESAQWDWSVEVTGAGRVALPVSVTAVDDADGEVGPASDSITGVVGGLTVEVIGPDKPVKLEALKPGDTDADGNPLPLNADGTLKEPGFKPAEVVVTVKATAPPGNLPLKLVKLNEMNSRDVWLRFEAMGRVPGGGMNAWTRLIPQPLPFPVEISKAPSPTQIVTLDPGKTVEFPMTLTVAEPGSYELTSVVSGVLDTDEGRIEVKGHSSTVLPVGGDTIVVVEFAADPVQGRVDPTIEEGEQAKFHGTIRNISKDKIVAFDPLDVPLAGAHKNGLVLGPVEAGNELPLPGDLTAFNPTLGPGEEIDFDVSVQTSSFDGIDSSLLTGRGSVLVDLALSGVVIDDEAAGGDGAGRDLAPTDIDYQIGTGKFHNSDGDFVRVRVTAKVAPLKELSALEFTKELATQTVSQLLDRGGQLLLAVPQMIAGAGVAVWKIGKGSALLSAHVLESQLASVQYFWAYSRYLAQLAMDVPADLRETMLEATTAEVMDHYRHLFEDDVTAAAEVKAAIDRALTGLFSAVLTYSDQVYDAAEYGFTEQFANRVAASFAFVGEQVVAEIATAGLISILGKMARSPQVANALERAGLKRQADADAKVASAAEEVRAEGLDPRIDAAPQVMRGLEAGAKVDARAAEAGWGVDKVSDANLRRMTDVSNGGLPIMVALRSRADETLEWLATQLGITLKPFLVKTKSANWIDETYLGYRRGAKPGYGPGDSDLGSVVLVEPMPRERVLAQLDAEGVNDFTRQQVLDRYDTRFKEWYGVDCCTIPEGSTYSSYTQKLKDATPVTEIVDGRVVRKGSLDLPKRDSVPIPGDNADTLGAPALSETRRLELRQVQDPARLSREYWEVWLEAPDGSLRRVGGDLDTVVVSDLTGSTLKPKIAENVAQQLQHGTDMQHPWTSTFTNQKVRDKMLAEHNWHPDPAKRGEPLIIYANGEARVGWFDATKAVSPDNPLDAVVWLDGGVGDVEKVVQFQKDLRKGMIDPDVAKDGLRVHLPGAEVVKKAILNTSSNPAAALAQCSISTSRSGATIFRLSQQNQLQARGADGTWTDTDPESACDGGEIVVMPDTALTGAAPMGTDTLKILDELLGEGWKDVFKVGDCILIDAGNPNEESACIKGHGSLILEEPLRFDHADMATVTLLTLAEERGGSLVWLWITLGGLVVIGGSALLWMRRRPEDSVTGAAASA